MEKKIENIIGEILISKGLTIATAESCTGGLLAGTLINYSGISSIFMEGVITYSNEAKMKRIGVSKDTLDAFGAVSKDTAEEMARGICKVANTKIGISTTGIAGPGGGTYEKPVGLVYMGLCINGEVFYKKFDFKGDRQQIRLQVVNSALEFLLEYIK